MSVAMWKATTTSGLVHAYVVGPCSVGLRPVGTLATPSSTATSSPRPAMKRS
jgi:hypothetical protein